MCSLTETVRSMTDAGGLSQVAATLLNQSQAALTEVAATYLLNLDSCCCWYSGMHTQLVVLGIFLFFLSRLPSQWIATTR